MTDARLAKLAWLTDPEPGVFIINVQVDDELQRFQISRDQLLLLNQKAADMLVKAFK